MIFMSERMDAWIVELWPDPRNLHQRISDEDEMTLFENAINRSKSY